MSALAQTALVVLCSAAFGALLVWFGMRHALDASGEQYAQAMARVRDLEQQVDVMHAQGLVIEPPPPRSGAGERAEPLPAPITAVIGGIESPEHRAELEELARHRIAQGDDPKRIAQEMMGTVPEAEDA